MTYQKRVFPRVKDKHKTYYANRTGDRGWRDNLKFILFQLAKKLEVHFHLDFIAP